MTGSSHICLLCQGYLSNSGWRGSYSARVVKDARKMFKIFSKPFIHQTYVNIDHLQTFIWDVVEFVFYDYRKKIYKTVN